MYWTEQLANDFPKPGTGAGDTVMLHPSVGAVGEVACGPDHIHVALKSMPDLRGGSGQCEPGP